ncbi:hypothetical protein VMCG_03192 [Cytospora schulzeri]|uniref:Transcription activator GCR1-like domain-containing protein n=1 Tax=Cytospora schulzeri TaxID=448051 RepID=A0A423WXT6_9PEZI|nr:hypothetical protein VMCG_03192 [Valsa malicola]
MQSSYEQQLANLQSQHAIVSRQLEQLTNILNTHFTSQISAIQSVQQPAPVPPPISGFVGATPRPGGGVATLISRQEHSETPSYAASSPSQTPTVTSLRDTYDKVEIKIIPSSVPNQPPTVVPSRLDSVDEVWHEYRYGRDGNPSLESVEVRWGPRWRRDYKVQRWFNKRKIIVDKIMQYIADGVDEQAAMNELQVMRKSRTLNWLSRELESHRKETKKQWKAAREAAIANKQAMLGSDAMPANLA